MTCCNRSRWYSVIAVTAGCRLDLVWGRRQVKKMVEVRGIEPLSYKHSLVSDTAIPTLPFYSWASQATLRFSCADTVYTDSPRSFLGAGSLPCSVHRSRGPARSLKRQVPAHLEVRGHGMRRCYRCRLCLFPG